MHLPHSEGLSIGKLAGSFANTSATYKFYWLLAIVELIEEGNSHISKRDIFSRMISNSWYTVNYFHVSFGKQDVIQKATESILQTENLTIDIKKETLLAVLKNAANTTTLKALDHFNKNVPHRFLSPWFPSIGLENENILRNRIYEASQRFENNCIYALYENHIVINPDWIPYLVSNAKIIKDFCYWNLALFLQSRNPNVPNIPNKLMNVFKYSDVAAEKTAYALVMTAIRTYKGIEHMNFEAESLATDNFIAELRNVQFSEARTLLGLNSHLNVLETANSDFKDLFDTRSTAINTTEVFDTKALRKAILYTYKELAEYVLVMAKRKNTAYYIELLTILNTGRSYYSDILARRGGNNGDAT